MTPAVKSAVREAVTAARERVRNERLAVARALYESLPDASFESVTAESRVGLSAGRVRKIAAKQGWRKAAGRQEELSGRALELANKIRTRMSELGKPMDDAVAASEAGREVGDGFAVDVRAQVLDRHRKEWSAPRKIAYEAVQKSDFERAKLAKITAETLTLIQAGECRAYGIKPDEKEGATVVVVQRSAGSGQAGPDLPAVTDGDGDGDGEDF